MSTEQEVDRSSSHVKVEQFSQHEQYSDKRSAAKDRLKDERHRESRDRDKKESQTHMTPTKTNTLCKGKASTGAHSVLCVCV